MTNIETETRSFARGMSMLTNPAPRTEQAPAGTVQLYEDNAGGLHIWAPFGQRDLRGYSGLEAITADGKSFSEDARALLEGDTDDWTLPRATEENVRLLREWAADGSGGARLVATYEDGVVTIDDEHLGFAAREYLEADIAWARDREPEEVDGA